MLLHYWTPLALVRAVIDGMRARQFGRIVNITSAMVAAPHSSQAPSAGARTGLWAVMKGMSRTLMKENGLSMAAIAQAAGFAHQSHMARHMRRVLGAAPLTVKRRLTDGGAR